MESVEENEDREYWVARLLDGYFNLWVEVEFVAPLLSVVNRMPLPALKQLIDKEPVLFAPEPNIGGRVYPAPSPGFAGRFIVYFSPDLLSRPQAYIEAVIAHEFAHLVLGHDEIPCQDARERALEDEKVADELAESWGFKIPPELKRY